MARMAAAQVLSRHSAWLKNCLAAARSLGFVSACVCGLTGGLLADSLLAQEPAAPATKTLRAPDVEYEPSEMRVVRAMLRLAKVDKNDVVYDLGCGDGRVVITAIREFGARGVCVDIDPKRTAETRANAARAGTGSRIEIRTEDMFQTEIVGASVVMLFLWPDVNMKLRPRLLRELLPGTRVVSHFHDMQDWTPQQVVRVRAGNLERNLYLWIIPPR